MTCLPARIALCSAAAALILLAGVTQTAMADGDPASDYLISQPVFTPIHPPATALKLRLIALAHAARKQGFPIRVAIIQAPIDLGAIPQLLGKPSTYARFLGAELRFAYRGRLLVVMQQGYGYTQKGKPVPGAKKLLRSLPRPPGNSPDQLTTAAIAAIRRIAAASGHKLPANPPLPHVQGNAPATPTRQGSSFLRRNAVLLAATAVALGSSVALCVVLIRSRRERGDDPAAR